MAKSPSSASHCTRLSHHAVARGGLRDEYPVRFFTSARRGERYPDHALFYPRIHDRRLVCDSRCLARAEAAKIDIQFLMIAVALGALFVKGWTEGATLLFLFSLSNGLEQFANYRTRRTIDSLLKAAPKMRFAARRAAGGEVPVEQVEPGDELLVKAGELFPVDGIVIEGDTSADESALTGEVCRWRSGLATR